MIAALIFFAFALVGASHINGINVAFGIIKKNAAKCLVSFAQTTAFAIFTTAYKINRFFVQMKMAMPEELCRLYFYAFVRDHLLLIVHVDNLLSHKLMLIAYSSITWGEFDKHIRLTDLMLLVNKMNASELRIHIGKINTSVVIYVSHNHINQYMIVKDGRQVTGVKPIRFNLIDL